MSKPTVSAAGGAMPAEGDDPDLDLLDVADALDQVRNLIIGASNLAASPDPHPAGLHAVIIAAEEKLDFARDAFAAIRGEQQAESGKVPSRADPVFAAIARHKKAYAAYVDATCNLTGLEVDAYRRTHDDVDRKALEAFLATVPTTLAGLRAALAYAVEVDSGCIPDNAGRIAETLLKSPIFAGMSGEGSADV